MCPLNSNVYRIGVHFVDHIQTPRLFSSILQCFQRTAWSMLGLGGKNKEINGGGCEWGIWCMTVNRESVAECIQMLPEQQPQANEIKKMLSF